jgi:hypothetical protein
LEECFAKDGGAPPDFLDDAPALEDEDEMRGSDE